MTTLQQTLAMARAMANGEWRVEAFYDVVEAQIKAGAGATLKRMADVRGAARPLSKIAVAQAEAGDAAQALAVATTIEDAAERAQTLADLTAALAAGPVARAWLPPPDPVSV